MPSAIGGSSAPGGPSTPAKPSRGALWVDVRDYGAVADGGTTDNSTAIQAAVDDLKTRMSVDPGLKGVVYIPSGPKSMVVNRSIFVDGDGIEIQGDGWGSAVAMVGGSKQPTFIFGIGRVQSHTLNGVSVDQVADASYRPDLFGKLDSGVAPAAGVRWGLRTNNDSFVQFVGTPLSAGAGSSGGLLWSDQYSETNKLTIEFCIEPPDGQLFPAGAKLFSCGRGQGAEPSPFTVQVTDPGTVEVTFRTSDIEPGNHFQSPVITHRGFDFSIAGAAKPYEIAIQFDHDNAVCTAFVNRQQVALTNLKNMAPDSNIPYTPHAGLTFVMNDHYPFMIGADGMTGPYGGPTGVDLRVYGLRLSNTIRYQNNGVGAPQVRADAPSTPLNHSWAYFGNDVNTTGFLAGTDNPTTAGRAVTVGHGGAVNGGYSAGFLMHSMGSPRWYSNNGVRNLAVRGSGGHGQVISVGNVFEFVAENVRACGGYHGIGSFPMSSSYTIYLRDCRLDGTDAGYFGAIQLVDARGIYFDTSGRVTIRTVGCSDSWEDVFVAGWAPTCECIYKARSYPYGGNKTIKNLTVDFEGYPISRAGIYCEMHPYTSATSLVLKDVYFGTNGPTSSVLMLKDVAHPGGGLNRCFLSVENLQALNVDYTAVVDLDGPLWHGEIRGLTLHGSPILHRQKFGKACNVVNRDTKFTAPPTRYHWYTGAHVLEVRSPADGQYAEWRCVGTGTYGTPAPPAWIGLNPLNASPNGLAAYVLNHAYFTAALS